MWKAEIICLDGSNAKHELEEEHLDDLFIALYKWAEVEQPMEIHITQQSK